MVDKILPMTGFEPWISGVGSNHSTNWATTTALKAELFTCSQVFNLLLLTFVLPDEPLRTCRFPGRGRSWSAAASRRRSPGTPSPGSLQSEIYEWIDDTRRGSIAQWLAYLLPNPAALGSNPSISKKNSEEKIVDVAEVNQQCCLGESGQWFENVVQTHLAVASGKLVLRKKICLNSEQKSGTKGFFIT